jgi:hypothetical protein
MTSAKEEVAIRYDLVLRLIARVNLRVDPKYPDALDRWRGCR